MVKEPANVEGEGQDIACEFYTPKEVATILNLSLDTVYDLLREGRLPAIKLGTGRRLIWRVHKDELDAFLRAVRTGPPLKRHDDELRTMLRKKIAGWQEKHDD